MVNRINKQQGFTLIEIMVVVVILGILASVVVPRIMDNPDKARAAKAKHDIQALESALDVYRLDNFKYPSTDEGLEALVTQPSGAANWKAGGYVKKLNSDPWGGEYVYLLDADGTPVITSYGADAAPGGDGPNTDISSKDVN